jgi:hypothetical protein
MFDHFRLKALLLAGLALPLASCSNNGLSTIQIAPTTASLTVGQIACFTAEGFYGNGSKLTSKIITNLVQWTSTSSILETYPNTAGATAEPGCYEAVSAGTAEVGASAQGYKGVISASATVTVAAQPGTTGTGTPSSEGLVSLTIIPSSITVGNLQDTGNFLAIGTYTVAPEVRDVTNSVVWISSEPDFFPVDSNTGGDLGATAGIVTAYASGTNITIMAEVTDPVTQSIQYATAAFSCPLVFPCPCPTCDPPITIASCPSGPVAGSCFPGSQVSALLSTVTVYNEGLNTTNWEVTAPSATGTPNVIHCGPGWTLNGGTGGSVCVSTYPIGTPLVLTAPAGAGAFGGWSVNCTAVVSPTNLTPTTITAGGPNYCELNPTTSNETVGAIFN